MKLICPQCHTDAYAACCEDRCFCGRCAIEFNSSGNTWKLTRRVNLEAQQVLLHDAQARNQIFNENRIVTEREHAASMDALRKELSEVKNGLNQTVEYYEAILSEGRAINPAYQDAKESTITVADLPFARIKHLEDVLSDIREMINETIDAPANEIQPLTGTWIARCTVCGQEYPQHVGSTPCCGALAEVIRPPV